MDVETENVLKIICRDNIPDVWKENTDLELYLTKLGSYGVENLEKEPNRLKEEETSVFEQTQELAFSNYKTFIQTAECSREIFKQFGQMEGSLNNLLERIPKFSQNCESLARVSAEIDTHRRLNSLVLNRNSQLLEILELPQLMNLCIQNGCYEEALELAAYVRRLGNKHGNIPIIASIVQDVESAWVSMLHQLLAQLRTDLQLPRCLQIVGYLRRMEIFSESELRLKFLQARDSWLQGLLAEIPTLDATYHLSKTVELTRIHLFNIITQFRAIFSDNDPILPKDQNVNDTAIYYSWLTEKIQQFLHTLERDLNKDVGNSLDSIIGQCMYFGLSLSRVGADFRGLLAPIFIRTVSRNFEKAVKMATKKFEEDLEKFSLPKNVLRIMKPLGASTNLEYQPPECLLEFYPLADYCNGLLTAFNSLRLCAPLAAADNATNILMESLCFVVRLIVDFHNQEQQAMSQSESEAFNRLCLCFADGLLPYIQSCLHAVFPVVKIAGHLGISTLQLQQEGLTYLDSKSILEPMQKFLPSVQETQQLLLGEDLSLNFTKTEGDANSLLLEANEHQKVENTKTAEENQISDSVPEVNVEKEVINETEKNDSIDISNPGVENN